MLRNDLVIQGIPRGYCHVVLSRVNLLYLHPLQEKRKSISSPNTFRITPGEYGARFHSPPKRRTGMFETHLGVWYSMTTEDTPLPHISNETPPWQRAMGVHTLGGDALTAMPVTYTPCSIRGSTLIKTVCIIPGIAVPGGGHGPHLDQQS